MHRSPSRGQASTLDAIYCTVDGIYCTVDGIYCTVNGIYCTLGGGPPAAISRWRAGPR